MKDALYGMVLITAILTMVCCLIAGTGVYLAYIGTIGNFGLFLFAAIPAFTLGTTVDVLVAQYEKKLGKG